MKLDLSLCVVMPTALELADGDASRTRVVRVTLVYMSSLSDPDFDWSGVEGWAVGSAKSEWPSEVRDLTPWVIEHLRDISRELGMQLVLVEREARLGTFRADIAAHDSSFIAAASSAL